MLVWVFPDEEMHGVDILILILLILEKSKIKLLELSLLMDMKTILVQPYLFKEMQFPVYGTSLPLEMIGSKFDEHKIKRT